MITPMETELTAPAAADLSERWLPLSVSHPVREDQEIRLYVPGILDDTGPIRFGSILWSDAEDTE